MTDDGTPRRRALVAAVLWLVLAFCIWNVRFDWGVRVCASQYLNNRSAYLQGHGPEVELADAMDRGVADARQSATLLALPVVAVAAGLIVCAVRGQRWSWTSRTYSSRTPRTR